MKPSVKIRQAEPEDLKEVIKLGKNLLAYDHEYDSNIDLTWLDSARGKNYVKSRIMLESGIVLLAIDQGEIIGYLIGGLVEPESYVGPVCMAELEECFILEDYRNVGIGRKLFTRFCKWATSSKVSRMQVRVSAFNYLATEFYRKVGFVDYDLIMEMDI